MLNENILEKHNTYNGLNTMQRNLVGPTVRQARNLARPPLTQGDLVARLQVMGMKVDQPTISKIELGRRPVLDFEVVALAKALGVTSAWLLNETPSE